MTPQAAPAENGMVTRYQDGYRVGKFVDTVGSMCKGIGVILALIGGVTGLSLANSHPQFGNANFSEFGIIILVAGVIIGLSFWVVGVLISAQGQLLKAVLDTAVNSSPFITDAQRREVMSLL
jgi:hypothetical protein